MRSDIKALIFDLDGTLADTIPAIAEAINMTMRELSLPTHTEDEVKSFIGKGPRHLVSESLPKDKRDADACLVDRALAIYNYKYSQTYLHTDRLYDGIEEALITLSKHYKIAVLSNKQDEYVKALVKQLLPQGIYQIACGSIDCIPAKPSPELALTVIKELGVAPHECVMIGDSDVDILTAKNAGLHILAVAWGYMSKDELSVKGAKDILDDPRELTKYFI